MLQNYSTEQLEEEILKRKNFKKEKPKLLKNVNVVALRKLCSKYIDFVDSDDYSDDNDYAGYIFEVAMTTFYGDDIWEWVR